MTGSRRLSVRVAAAALLATLLALPATSADAADLATVVGTGKRAFPKSGTTVTFPVDVPADVATSPIGVAVADIARGTTPVPADAVRGALDAKNGTLVLTLVSPGAFATAGEYDVSLLLTGSGQRQRVAVTLVREATVLSVGGTVAVENVVGPLSRWNADHAPALSVGVDSGGDLASLSARQVEHDRGDVRLTAPCEAGSCALDSGSPVVFPTPVAPGGSLRLGYTTEGFRLGTTTRVVELRSPQLTAPVNVTYQVTTRRSPWLIPIIAATGLLLGLLLRVALTRALDATNRRRARLDLQAAIAGIKGEYDDDQLTADLRGPADAVSNAKVSLAQIEAETARVAAALDAANERLRQARTANEASAALVAGEWQLPPVVSEQLDQLGAALGRTRAAIEQRQVSVAQQEGAAAATAAADLRQVSVDWLTRYAQAAEVALAALPSSATEWEVSDLRRALEQAKELAAPPAKSADVRVALQAVHSASLDWNSDVRPALAAVVAEFRSRDTGLATAIDQELARGDAADRLGGAADPLGQLIATAAPSASPGGPPGKARPEAARRTRDSAEAPATTGSTVLLPAYPLALRQQIGVLPRRALLALSFTATTVLRYLGLAVIACVVAYWVGAEAWIGTRDQIMIVFGWAFALDLSVQAVTAMFATSTTAPPNLVASAK